MPLKFVFGPSGSGKSYHLYNHIIQESMAHPDQNFIVLVPEQFTMQTQKDLVELHPKKGIMNIDVLSFNRLAYRVFEETGGDQLPVLDDEGKNLILRKIAVNENDNLKVLRGNMKKLGYISEIKSVISEFTQYDIGEEEIARVMDSAGQDSRLNEKLQDILVLYRGFQDYLQEKYITKEELLDVLAEQVSQSKMLRNSTIALDGFTGFTPVQNRLLRELLLCCRDVWVTVTMDPKEDPYTYDTPYQLFALGKHMTTSLLKLAKDAKVPVKEPLCLYDEVPYRFRYNPTFAFLEKNLFRQRQETYTDPQDTIRLAVADSPREESLYAASQIRALVRKENLRYRDIGIIVSDMETYGDYLEQAFAQYEIPYFMDHKRSLLLNSFVEYLRSLLDMIRQNFTGDSVIRFLRTGYTDFTEDQIDALDNYSRGTGIRGYKKWEVPWDFTLSGMTQEELDALNHMRVQFVEDLGDLQLILKHAKLTVREITQALYDFIVKNNLQVQLKQQEDTFREDHELALAREYAQVYRVVMDLFDKFVDLLGDETVTLDEYCKLLDAGLEEAKVGVVPPSVDQVVAGDLERTRLKDIKVLFLLGAGNAYLPGSLVRNGLLTEQDRQQFDEQGLDLSANGKERAYEQKYYLYLHLTKPSEKLYVSFSRAASGNGVSEGNDGRPSYVIQELIRLFPSLKITDVSDLPLQDQELTPRQGILPLVKGLREGAAGTPILDPDDSSLAPWRELYTWYRRKDGWQDMLARLTNAAYAKKPEQRLSPATAEDLYGLHFQTSITRMEQFAKCPYSQYLQYGLRLRERPAYHFSNMDLGTVCHDALDRYARKIRDAGKTWADVTEQESIKLVRTCVDEAVAGYGNSVMHSSFENEDEIRRIKNLLIRNVQIYTWQLAQGDFRPARTEYKFKNGKIDRIDLCEQDGQVLVKVMDYKTGSSQTYDENAIYNGLDLQLMVYMDTALAQAQKWYPSKEVVPAGVFYSRVQAPFEEKGQDVEKKILQDMRPDGVVNLEDGVPEHLDHQQSGHSLVASFKYDKNGDPQASGSPAKAVSEEYLRLLMEHTVSHVDTDRQEILTGNVDAFPYWDQNPDMQTADCACKNCPYRGVCRFDTRVPGYAYQTYRKKDHDTIYTELIADQDIAEKDKKDSGNKLDE